MQCLRTDGSSRGQLQRTAAPAAVGSSRPMAGQDLQRLVRVGSGGAARRTAGLTLPSEVLERRSISRYNCISRRLDYTETGMT